MFHHRMSQIPDVLKMRNGTTVTTAKQWISERRPELIELFREHVYGREPVLRPESLQFKTITTENRMDGKALRRQVEITFEGHGGTGTIHLLLFIPQSADKQPAPAFVLINNRGSAHTDPERESKSPFWPAEKMIASGYAAAVFSVEDVDPDHDDGFQNGVHRLFDPPGKPRTPDAWGTIAAWAWGASRVMDYLETDPLIDDKHVNVVGHSRGGKTALWAGALDERFAMVVSNNSGSTGAAIARGKQGESIRIINTRFPHWFNENYKAYNDKEDELPVDQHMLLALIAPRKLYVSSATEDTWADPQSEFISTVLASKAYSLYGMNGLGTAQFPQPDSPRFGDHVGYHLRTGQHDLTEYDWSRFIEFDLFQGTSTEQETILP